MLFVSRHFVNRYRLKAEKPFEQMSERFFSKVDFVLNGCKKKSGDLWSSSTPR